MEAVADLTWDFSALVQEIPTAHRSHGVCPARLAAFFSEDRGWAALSAVYSRPPPTQRTRETSAPRGARAKGGGGGAFFFGFAFF